MCDVLIYMPREEFSGRFSCFYFTLSRANSTKLRPQQTVTKINTIKRKKQTKISIDLLRVAHRTIRPNFCAISRETKINVLERKLSLKIDWFGRSVLSPLHLHCTVWVTCVCACSIRHTVERSSCFGAGADIPTVKAISYRGEKKISLWCLGYRKFGHRACRLSFWMDSDLQQHSEQYFHHWIKLLRWREFIITSKQ